MDEINEPETAVLLLFHLDSRKGIRKRSAKEWLSKYFGGDIKPVIYEMDRLFRTLENCNEPMTDKEMGYTLMRIFPSTISSALIRGESYDSMVRLVTHEVTRINAEYQDLPQVHFADAPSSFQEFQQFNGYIKFIKVPDHEAEAVCKQAELQPQGREEAGGALQEPRIRQ